MSRVIPMPKITPNIKDNLLIKLNIFITFVLVLQMKDMTREKQPNQY